VLLFGKNLSLHLEIPLICEMHDVESTIMKTLGKSREEIEFMQFLQYAASQFCHGIICMSNIDYKELQSFGINKRKIYLIPNGVDISKIPYFGPNFKKKTVLFLGNLYYEPNRRAVERILERIYPRVIKRLPEIKFLFVGRTPKELFKKYQSVSNVIFLGEIENLNKILKETTIAISPIKEGSGMKVKNLIYAAAGLPIISTKKGVAGYVYKNNIICEEDIDNYWKIILYLLRNKKEAIKWGQKARKMVELHYQWSKLVPKVIECYQKIFQNGFSKIFPLGKYFHNAKIVKNFIEVTTKEVPLPQWMQEGRLGKTPNIKDYIYIKQNKILKQRIGKFNEEFKE
jgi:glycosyltransferase involved in cell wall biosynthesis